MTPGGIPIAGRTVKVPGLTVLNSADASWCTLDPGDYGARKTTWVRQLVIHSTKGDYPQHVKPGKGLAGAARNVADFWHRDPAHSAAQIVIDRDGTVLCLADLAYTCAYHATVSNDWSVGIELYQEFDGGIYEAVLDAAVRLVPALCDALGVPFTVVADPYHGHPLQRFLDGAPDFAGVYGHRNNTEQRGRGDPGDEIFTRLIAAGGEPVLAAERQDLELGRQRQKWLNAADACTGATLRPLVVDGLVGPASLATARRQGFGRWRDVPTA